MKFTTKGPVLEHAINFSIWWIIVVLAALNGISQMPVLYFFYIYGDACVQLAHSSWGDWKDIFVTHFIIILKSEVSNLPIVVFFLWLCVWGGCTIILSERLKMLVNYIRSSVCLRLSNLSQLSFILYMGLCVISLPNPLVMIVRMSTLS